MFINSKISCPDCGTDCSNSLSLKRVNIKDNRLEDNNSSCEDGTCKNDGRPICQKTDTIFFNCKCEKCNKKFDVMAVVDVKLLDIFTADNRSKLVMLK